MRRVGYRQTGLMEMSAICLAIATRNSAGKAHFR